MAEAKPRCPYLAINIPGERPFVVERRLYESATRGINIVDTTLAKEVVKEHGEIWVLTIKHSTPSRQGSLTWGKLKFYNLLQAKFKSPYQYSEFKRGLADWAARAFKKKQAVAAGPHQKQIARLEKELGKLYAHQPKNPLLRVERVYSGDREYRERWAKDRSQRMQLAMIGGLVLHGAIPAVKGYELLAEAGYEVTKWGKVKERDRRHTGVGFEQEYWKKLYLFTRGLMPVRRPSYTPTPLSEQLLQHRDHRIQFLVDAREIASVKAQIESIKLLAEAVMPAANETGVVYA